MERVYILYYMELLPEEMILEVFLTVPFGELRKVLALNKRARKIGQSQYFWERRAELDLGIGPQIFRRTSLPPGRRYFQLRNLPLIRLFFTKVHELGCVIRDQGTARDHYGYMCSPYLEFYDVYSSLPHSIQVELRTLALLDYDENTKQYQPTPTKLIDSINCQRFSSERMINSAVHYLSLYE